MGPAGRPVAKIFAITPPTLLSSGPPTWLGMRVIPTGVRAKSLRVSPVPQRQEAPSVAAEGSCLDTIKRTGVTTYNQLTIVTLCL